ncbi:hypothetical protein H920_17815 [Fukomys damarensis]|uniref:Uncharacterized protein n=1 Tax=Fukomys damarensis TaxID=885580 RepID=A0A091CP71_FUKDA|nr:hypothetical protein H920_17815 [Fukomys damarensis]
MPACVILTNQAPLLRRREPPSPADSHPEFMQGMKNPEIMARDKDNLKSTEWQGYNSNAFDLPNIEFSVAQRIRFASLEMKQWLVSQVCDQTT